MTTRIPTWIKAWVFLIALLPLAFGVQGYLDPAAHFGDEATAAGLSIYSGPIGLYVGRNMASVAVTLFALSQRSAPMLIVVLLLRAVTDVFDVLNNAIAGTLNAELIFFATLWISGSALAISRLRAPSPERLEGNPS